MNVAFSYKAKIYMCRQLDFIYIYIYIYIYIIYIYI